MNEGGPVQSWYDTGFRLVGSNSKAVTESAVEQAAVETVTSWYDAGLRLEGSMDTVAKAAQVVAVEATMEMEKEVPKDVPTEVPEVTAESLPADSPPPLQPPPPLSPPVVSRAEDTDEALLEEVSSQWSQLSLDASELLTSLGKTGASFGKAVSSEMGKAEVGVPASQALESTKRAGSALVDWAKLVSGDELKEAESKKKLELTGKELKSSLESVGETLVRLVSSVGQASSDNVTAEAATAARKAFGETGKRLVAVLKLYTTLAIQSKNILPPAP